MMTKSEMARIVKETVSACETPEDLDRFLAAYIQGVVAGHFVDQMNAPGQRAAWVAQMREKYPADFAAVGQA